MIAFLWPFLGFKDFKQGVVPCRRAFLLGPSRKRRSQTSRACLPDGARGQERRVENNPRKDETAWGSGEVF